MFAVTASRTPTVPVAVSSTSSRAAAVASSSSRSAADPASSRTRIACHQSSGGTVVVSSLWTASRRCPSAVQIRTTSRPRWYDRVNGSGVVVPGSSTAPTGTSSSAPALARRPSTPSPVSVPSGARVTRHPASPSRTPSGEPANPAGTGRSRLASATRPSPAAAKNAGALTRPASPVRGSNSRHCHRRC